MTKKHLSGFVPVDFHLVGKIMLGIGIVLILLAIVDLLIEKIVLLDKLFYFGLGFVLVGLYLIFVVPKEEI